MRERGWLVRVVSTVDNIHSGNGMTESRSLSFLRSAINAGRLPFAGRHARFGKDRLVRFHGEALSIRSNIADARDIGGLMIFHRAPQNKKMLLLTERLPLIQVKRA
jgi:hypothetical protein